MNLLSRRSLVAIATTLDVALHARPTPVTAKALAARHALPPRHLETLLQALVRAGILKGLRGPRGGYELARERRRVSVGEIVRAVQGAPSDAVLGASLVDDVVAPAVAKAGAVYLRELDRITVEDLCRRVEPDGSPNRNPDFTI